MQVADRSEIYEGEVPVGNRGLLSRLISRMNKYAYDAAAASEAREEGLKKKKTTDTPDSPLLYEFDYELNKVIQLLSILYDTHSRRPLVRNDDWVSTSRGCLNLRTAFELRDDAHSTPTVSIDRFQVLHTASFESRSVLFGGTGSGGGLISALVGSLFTGMASGGREPVRPYDRSEAILASRLPWTLPFRVRAFHLQDVMAADRVGFCTGSIFFLGGVDSVDYRLNESK